jgi:TolB-like protein
MRTLVILLALMAVAGLAEQPAIAIVDFEAVNCDIGIAKAVGEIMRTEIIATGKYRVIERAELAQVLEEHAFQRSGLVDASTIAELGRLVGADYVAVGSVSRLAGTYTVAVRYIDVETGEAALGRTETADGEGMLPDVCRRLAAALTSLPYSGTSGGGYSSESPRATVMDKGANVSSEAINEISSYILQRRGQILAIYKKYLSLNPNLHGRIAFKVTFSNGVVSNVSVTENDTGNTQMESEIVGVIRGWAVGGVQGKVTLSVPFVFSPK